MLILFAIISLMMLASAVAVVSFRNPIYSALSLIANLLGMAALFATLDAHFLATTQVIVYAGALMVLVVFLIMLLNLKDENPNKTSKYYLGMVVMVALLFAYAFVPAVNETFKIFPDTVNFHQGTVKNIGEILYTKYIFQFEIASVLILVGVVGAVMLAERRKK